MRHSDFKRILWWLCLLVARVPHPFALFPNVWALGCQSHVSPK